MTAVATLGLTAATMAQTVPSYVPSNGLVGWWPFNNNANDESGNGNNGTVTGPTLTNDRFGNAGRAYNFNGTSDYISVPNIASSGNAARSICSWVKSTSNIQNCIVSTGNYNVTSIRFNLVMGYGPGAQTQPGKVGVMGFNNDFYPNTGQSVNNNKWHLVCATYNGAGSVKTYVDGILDNSGSKTYNTSGQLNYFGKSSDINNGGGNQCFFNGLIDDIGIWNRALTDQEISDLYNANSCSNDLTINPSTNIQNIGGNAIFTATTSDSNPIYTWQSDLGQGFQTLNNYGNYSGVNTNTLSITNVQLSENNQQVRAISTSGNCTDTSNIATIQITDTCITNVTVYDTTYITVQDTLLTTVTDTLIINTTLSLPAPNNENTILIYPNPASDHITINNGNFSAMAGYSIKITNNAGQQVFQSSINQQQFYVDLSTWTGNGLYFVHLIDPQNNPVTVRKIVLQ